ncbi:MAG: YraN family protein [Acidobacteriota bacterium]|nr:YraN family protein [Acidobacteriota bacterium]
MRNLLNLSTTNRKSAAARLGALGERLAADFLERKGFRLVAANFVVPVGRNRRGALVNTEIDLIAYDGETLVFLEVKTRRSDDFAAPEQAVDLRKQRQITRAARAYRRIFRIEGAFRYDVVSIVLPDEKSKPKINLLENFWTEAKFRKRHWSGMIFAD